MKAIFYILIVAGLVWAYYFFTSNTGAIGRFATTGTHVQDNASSKPATGAQQTEDTGGYQPINLGDESRAGFWANEAHAATVDIKPWQARSMGSDDAPIQMYVFSSLRCSHCSTYHTDLLPKIESEYIDTGIVKMTYIDFPFDRPAMTGTMLARCVAPENYFKFLDVLFANQNKWAFNENAEEVVSSYAKLQGMSQTDIKVCLGNKALMKAIVRDRDFYMEKYNVTGTPTTVFIKGDQVKVVGGSDLKGMRDAIKALQ